jgi:dTMP kinase
MEDARVKREQEEARARVEAERAAAEAAARKLREDEEARRRAEDERLRRIEEEKHNRVREEQMRLEEAERRARVEGEMKLQEERMRLEIQSRSHGRSPVKAVVAAVIVVALVGGVFIYRMNAQHREEQAAALRERQLADEKAKAREAAFVQQLSAIKREMDEKMQHAKSEAERAKIRADAEAKEADAERRVGRAVHAKKPGTGADGQTSTTKAPKYKDPGKRDINDDILNGL